MSDISELLRRPDHPADVGPREHPTPALPQRRLGSGFIPAEQQTHLRPGSVAQIQSMIEQKLF